MKVVIQRVSHSSVEINENCVGKIGIGLLILVGFEGSDNNQDIEWISKKIIQLRVFPDENGVMNLSVEDIKGEILIVSQFTLQASTKKGNRPSYIVAAKPGIAIPLYNSFVEYMRNQSNLNVQTGEFGADMKISLVNDGPVTLIIDSKNKI
jgi:D-aminoacyl-tRNA deacylase